MSRLPFTIGTIHFCGIGGIGMSGIAEVLNNLGYSVQGSDIASNANVRRLRKIGIPIKIGQTADNIQSAKVVVVSSAVQSDNPELHAARERMIPVVRRAEMLAELMKLKWSVAVAGTHGKTTTTSLIAAMLDHTGNDPTVINGGIINAYGTNARLGRGDWIVVEADESDGTFIKLPATIAVVTNIDPEHLDHWGSFKRLQSAFISFVQNIPFYGLAVLCIDDPEVQALIPKISDRRIVTYGFSPQADVRAINLTNHITNVSFDIAFSGRSPLSGQILKDVALPMIGRHNVQNALAAIAIAQEMGSELQQIGSGFQNFEGVKRRFTVTGIIDDITIIDDYGHHPVEISAALAAARLNAKNRVIAVVQPHRYTRLRDLFEDFCKCFNDADVVFIADVYAAGENPINGINRETLVNGLKAHGHRDTRSLRSPDNLPGQINEIAQSGDYILFLGAGDITNWANTLPENLSNLRLNSFVNVRGES